MKVSISSRAPQSSYQAGRSFTTFALDIIMNSCSGGRDNKANTNNALVSIHLLLEVYDWSDLNW